VKNELNIISIAQSISTLRPKACGAFFLISLACGEFLIYEIWPVAHVFRKKTSNHPRMMKKDEEGRSKIEAH